MHNLRIATPADALAIARVHVASWQETYSGLLSAEMIKGHTIESRAAMWARIPDPATPSNPTRVFVAERGNAIVGFASCGAQRTHHLRDAGYDGEFAAIYVLASAQRLGIGSALMQAMAIDLASRSFHGASLWVLQSNAAGCAFYQRMGGNIVSTQEDRRGETVLTELAYGWAHLQRLMR